MAYDAFVSYNHAADDRLAPVLRKTLQGIAKPWYRRRALRVFIDRASLTTTPSLWPTIQAAMDESSHYVLLASPQAAASKWVNQELDHWLSHHPADTVLLALTSGEIFWDDARGDFDWERTTALPERLRGVFRCEPLYSDLRGVRGRGPITPRDPEFRGRVAELAAAIRGVSKDQIVGDDLLQHRRVVRVTVSASIALLLLTAASVVLGLAADRERRRAETAADAERTARSGEEKARVAAQESLAANFVSNALAAADDVKALLYAGRAVDLVDTPLARGVLVTALSHTPRLAWTYPSGAGEITALSFLPDRRRFLSTSGDGVLRIWDSVTGAELARLAEKTRATELSFSFGTSSPKPPVEDALARVYRTAYVATAGAPLLCLALSPDGALAATGGFDGVVRIWDLERAQCLTVIDQDRGRVLSLAFSPDGRALVTARADDSIGTWKVPNGRALKRAEDAVAPVGEAGAPRKGHVGLWGVAYSPDGRRVYALRGDGKLEVRDAESLEATGVEAVVGRAPGSLALSGDGATIGVGTAEGPIELLSSDGLASLGVLRGHVGFVRSLAFSTDGTTLFSAGEDRTLRAWDLSTRTPRTVLRGHQEPVLALAIDGDRLLSGGQRALRLWDVGNGRTVSALLGHPGVNAAVYSPSLSAVATAGQDGTVRILDSETGRERRRWEPPAGCTSACYSPDGTLFATGGTRAIELWSTDTWEAVRQIDAFEHNRSVTFSQDGAWLAAGGPDGGIGVWETGTGRSVARWRGHEKTVQSVAFDPRDRGRLASGGEDKRVRVWDVESQRQVAEISKHTGQVWKVAFHPTLNYVVSAGADALLCYSDPTTGETQATLTAHEVPGSPLQLGIFAFKLLPEQPKRVVTGGGDGLGGYVDVGQWRAITSFRGHEAWVTGIDADAAGHRVLTAGYDHSVRCWDASGTLVAGSLQRPQARVLAVDFSPDGSRIACADADGAVAVFARGTQTKTHETKIGSRGAAAVAFLGNGWLVAGGTFQSSVWRIGEDGTLEAPVGDREPSPGRGFLSVARTGDGHGYVTGGDDGVVRRFQRGSGDGGFEAVESFPAQSGRVHAVAVRADGSMIATGGEDRTVRLWRSLPQGAKGEPRSLAVADLHTLPVYAVAFHPREDLLASAGGDGTIRLYGLDLEPRGVLRGHDEGVRAIAFSHDGRLLASCGDDETVRVWDLERKEERARLLGHRDRVRALAFHPAVDVLLTGSEDGSVRLWSLQGLDWPKGSCLQRAQDYCGHELDGMTVRPTSWNRLVPTAR